MGHASRIGHDHFMPVHAQQLRHRCIGNDDYRLAEQADDQTRAVFATNSSDAWRSLAIASSSDRCAIAHAGISSLDGLGIAPRSQALDTLSDLTRGNGTASAAGRLRVLANRPSRSVTSSWVPIAYRRGLSRSDTLLFQVAKTTRSDISLPAGAWHPRFCVSGVRAMDERHCADRSLPGKQLHP